MSILIKDIEMPKDGEHPYWVVIHSDGTVEYNENKGQGWQTSEAVPVPPHGRLIDADRLCLSSGFSTATEYGRGRSDQIEAIKSNAPTIIPAEEVPA